MLNQEIRQQPLATDIVRFVGKAVAAVVTQEPYQGDDAIELVSVDHTGACRKPCSRHATRRYSLIRLPMRVCHPLTAFNRSLPRLRSRGGGSASQSCQVMSRPR